MSSLYTAGVYEEHGPLLLNLVFYHKSVNLQYNTLGCLDDGTNESSAGMLQSLKIWGGAGSNVARRHCLAAPSDLPKSRGAAAPPAHPLATCLILIPILSPKEAKKSSRKPPGSYKNFRAEILTISLLLFWSKR